MKEYTVRELRANMREAFEEATKGTVRINRGGEYFYLTQELDEPDYDIQVQLAAPKVPAGHTVELYTARTYKDVLSDITAREKRRDEETDPTICQDPETRFNLANAANKEIAELWGEYHTLKGSNV